MGSLGTFSLDSIVAPRPLVGSLCSLSHRSLSRPASRTDPEATGEPSQVMAIEDSLECYAVL